MAASDMERPGQSKGMAWWRVPLDGGPIHLGAEPGAGGTTVGLHAARQVLAEGGRVLWMSPKLPDPTRFSQIIGSLPIQSSARFLSIETGGEANLGFRQLDAALRSIPGLGLVVLDDWAPASGPVSSDLSKGILNHISTWSSEIPHLLISTANQDASNGDEALRVRHRRELAEVGCRIGILSRSENGLRHLTLGEEVHTIRLHEDGIDAVE